jgi:hypothetical protein
VKISATVKNEGERSGVLNLIPDPFLAAGGAVDSAMKRAGYNYDGTRHRVGSVIGKAKGHG